MNDRHERGGDDPEMLPERLVLLVWSAGSGHREHLEWLGRLVAQSRGPVYSVGKWSGSCVSALGRHRRDFDGAVAAAGSLHPGHSVLLLRAGLVPPAPVSVLERIVSDRHRPSRLMFPGNHDDKLNPFSDWPGTVAIDQPACLAYWCGDGTWQPLEEVAADCLLLLPGTAFFESDGDAHACLVDDAFVLDPGRPVAPDSVHGQDHLVATGQLRLRLRHLALSGPDAVAAAPPGRKPVTLHIAHGWGGGVWRWIGDFIAGDADGIHLVLVAEGDSSGQHCGLRLKLFLGGPEAGLIREDALAPGIVSTVVEHAQYKATLQQIIERFGVGRVVVSSLIGHSLDCLATGLPTVQVLHDFYPLWPLLDFDPLGYLEDDGRIHLERALDDHGQTLRMRPADFRFWASLGARWGERVKAGDITLVAPSTHVIERWRKLCPDQDLQIARIAHAFRPFAGQRKVSPPSKGPLRLLIPGRLSRGKGLDLLRQALPELRRHARIVALGCGREGFRLFGEPGIDLIVNYRHEQFPELVEQLRPDAALFLSTVPETWNYTLSEVRALGVVPIATRVGSFPERIRDGEDGLLFEPEAEALVDLVRRLDGRREWLREMAESVVPESLPAEMVAAFDHLVAPQILLPAAHSPAAPLQIKAARLAARLADAEGELATERLEIERMEAELARRTDWAERLERQFRERTHWAKSLQQDLDQALEHLQQLQIEFDERTAWAKSLQQELETTIARLTERDRELAGTQQELAGTQQELAGTQQELAETSERMEDLAQRHDALEQEFQQIIHSRSWSLTRPLRVMARLARNARARSVFNPLRWPRLIARLAHHFYVRGFRQTLWLMQSPPVVAELPEPPAPLPVPEVGEIAEPVTHMRPDAPEVSVIVPVYNQLHYTSACLESLVSVATGLPFEIIVVDDCSTDQTRAWLKQCQGVTVVRNRRNQGFINSCNRGAKKARGRWLVFLNNDTRVTDGWLDALIWTFTAHPDAGIVGGKLIFGDGSLQEAGGIIFADGSGWNYGRGDDPEQPRYRFVSAADYVSGACLAIERSRFARLGGFDRHYAPAYYEDTDLCFRIRELGLKVYCQPAATVIHYEGGTSGTDETSGIKQHQVVNQDKFRQRWAGQLRRFPENPEKYTHELALRHRYREFAKRALVIDATTPMPDHDSGSVRMFALLKLLGELGYRTSFMPHNLMRQGRHSADLEQAGIEVLTAPWITDPEDWLAEHGAGLDLVVVSRHYVLSPLIRLLRKLCPDARLIFDTVDLHFLREQREAELSGSALLGKQAQKTRASELDLIGKADATLVVSEFEKQLLSDLVPDAQVQVVSNIHGLQDPGKPFEQRRDLVFVGGFQHPPNVDAAEWLIEDILPRVREHLPEVQLHLIGSRMPERISQRRAPGLRVHGFVDNLEPFMTGCRISVAPLRYGAGVKGKVNQAMSHGLPVVATLCAAEGMYTEHGVDILMADDAENFAAEVVRLYRDGELWQRLATNGRANVDRHFSVAAARRALEELLSN